MLEEQISKDYIAAMKAKDSLRSSTVNFLRAQLKNHKINNKLETLEDKDVLLVIKKQVKQRQDSIEQYQQAQRNDLVEKEQAELDILKGYLPEEMSEQQLSEIINEVIAQTGAKSMKDMGSVMKAVTEKTAGNADNKVVSEMVKKALSQQ